jgi:hypothetical protein
MTSAEEQLARVKAILAAADMPGEDENVPCRCTGIESFIRSDTADEYSGIGLVCTLCGRDFEVEEISR